VVFSVLLVLSMSVQAVLLTVWKDEIADPDYSALGNDAEGVRRHAAQVPCPPVLSSCAAPAEDGTFISFRRAI